MRKRNWILALACVALVAGLVYAPGVGIVTRAADSEGAGQPSGEVAIANAPFPEVAEIPLTIIRRGRDTVAPVPAAAPPERAPNSPLMTGCAPTGFAHSYSWLILMPESANCLQGFAMRFETGPCGDSLLAVRVWLSDTVSRPPEPGTAVRLQLLADNDSGVPDAANIIAETLIGGPGHEGDLYPLGTFGYVTWSLGGLKLPASIAYHVAVRWAGPIPYSKGTAIGADDFTQGEGDPTNRASVFFPGTYGTVDPGCAPAYNGWRNLQATYAINPDFTIEVDRCALGCYADGDIDGNGVVLTVADLVYLHQFLVDSGPSPAPMYRGDLNGDCQVDSADEDLLECYFVSGLAVRGRSRVYG